MKQLESLRKKRKFLVVLPILALPFITLAFWALGGGQRTGERPAKKQPQGLSRELPDAQVSGGPLDKMSLYEKAQRDSLKRQEQLRSDPYARHSLSIEEESLPEIRPEPDRLTASPSYADPNEEKVAEKLSELEALLNEPVETPPTSPVQDTVLPQDPGLSRDLDRLEEMMAMMGSSGDPDPEMAQINAMLEKILDIQYPERTREKIRELSAENKGQVYAVTSQHPSPAADLVQRAEAPVPALPDSLAFLRKREEQNGFYTTEQATPQVSGTGISIPATVHGTQTVLTGTTLKMRLGAPVYIAGHKIPEGTGIYGICSLEGERLKADITSIQYEGQFFPVTLHVYGMDGIEGIRVPGAIGRDAAKEGADRSIQGLDVMSLDSSPYGQAAGAGVEAVKGFFSKKAKLIKITVKDGDPVLLIDQNAKQHFQ